MGGTSWVAVDQAAQFRPNIALRVRGERYTVSADGGAEDDLGHTRRRYCAI